jgi:hypothetical protein
LLLPASVEFSPDKSRLYIINLALYLPFAGVPVIAVDSGWNLQVKHNIAVIDISPRQQSRGRRGLCPVNWIDTPSLLGPQAKPGSVPMDRSEIPTVIKAPELRIPASVASNPESPTTEFDR